MAFFVSGSSSGSFGQITVDGDIVPKRKALCPVDKHLDEVI